MNKETNDYYIRKELIELGEKLERIRASRNAPKELDECLLSDEERLALVFNLPYEASDLDIAEAVAQAQLNKCARYAEHKVKGRTKALFDEVICPMCYRLNPQHSTMDYGEGCHWCQEKEDWIEQEE